MLAIDVALTDGVHARLHHRFDPRLRISLPGREPVGHASLSTALGFKQPHDALGKIVFHIPLVQEVLPDQPFAADLAPAHQEFDIVDERAGNAELLNGCDLGSHFASDALQHEAVRTRS